MFSKLRYAVCRILFIIYGVFCMVTFGLGAFLLARLWLTSEAYRKSFALELTAPPMTSPDLNVVKIKSTWNADVFDCDQCTRCCRVLACPLIEEVNHKCLSYNSFFWRYFACGRYPISQAQIDFYDCPKWEMRE